MIHRSIPRSLLLSAAGAILLAMLMVLFLSEAGAPSYAQAATFPQQNVQRVVAQSVPVTYTIYLPLVTRKSPLQTVFGVQMSTVTEAHGLSETVAARSTWVGGIVIPWSDVEPNEGDRTWSALESVEQQLLNAVDGGLTPIVNVRHAPGWAQTIPPIACGPITATKVTAFASFMRDLVARYSAAPYNVKYWEIWNEPDVDATLGLPLDTPFGCWGDADDEYYGGGYYGEMLKEVYPAIKAADPQSQVLVGGLLLDCDPANASICKNGREKPTRFLEGILHAASEAGGDAGAYFDGVSFHGYDFYSKTLGSYANANWQTAWNTTGPVAVAKGRYLEGVLSAHGVTGKYLVNTETALLCDSCTDNATFETTKAYYLAQTYAAAIAEGWRASLWYTTLGWRNSGLLNPDLSPRPAYDAYRTGRTELQDAELVREIDEYGGVKGYVFDRDGHQVWLMWSLDGADHRVDLLFAPHATLDVFGNPLVASSTMTVTLAPAYVER